MRRIAHLGLTIVILFLTGCQYFKKQPQTLYNLSINGPKNVKLNLYQIAPKSDDQAEYIFMTQVDSAHPVRLPRGNYLLSNDCSAFQLNIQKSETVFLSTLNLKSNSDSNSLYTAISCKNFVTHKNIEYKTKNTFHVLPGETNFRIAGKQFVVRASMDQSKSFALPLYPFKLTSYSPDDTTTYFLYLKSQNLSDEKRSQDLSPLIANKVNKTIWLPKGEFEVEINGTKTTINIQNEQLTQFQLGGIKVLTPQNFYDRDKLEFINSPIFAYLNKSTLLQLDRIYSVFPEKYTITLGHSQLEETIDITPGSIKTLQTFGAQIDPPECMKTDINSCVFTQKVLIHQNNQSETLLSTALGEPFLVFQGEYEYTLEGMEGVSKRLKKSPTSIISERVGEIHIDWKLNISQELLETNKIEIESICCNISGKSNDINSYKPRKILLPSGEYRIASALRRERGLLTKKNIFANIKADTNNRIEIPIYAQSDQNLDFLFYKDEDVSEGPSTLIPIAP